MTRAGLRLLLWLKSLAAAFIGGGATAASSWLGVAGANAIGIDVPPLNFKTLGIVFLFSGIANAMAYLKRSPVPGYRRALAAAEVQASGNLRPRGGWQSISREPPRD